MRGGAVPLVAEAVLFEAGDTLYDLALKVEPVPREMTQTLPATKLNK